MCYERLDDDKAFRIVPLNETAVPQFTDFTIPHQVIPLEEEQAKHYVLEIQKNDGRCEIAKPKTRIKKYFTVIAGNQISFSSDMPYQRLWVRSKQSPLPRYKVPYPLPLDDGNRNYTILFPGSAHDVILCGDAYFEAVYDLQKA